MKKAVTTRPDVSFAASKLAAFLTNPSKEHMLAANRVLCYLAHMKHYCIKYDIQSSAPGQLFIPSSDASFADNPATRHSIQGHCFMLFGGLIDWKASKQRTVSTSSTEAELHALSSTAKELIWWERFFKEIALQVGQASIEYDNARTIRVIRHPTSQFTTKLRHIDVHRHWLRQEVVLVNGKYSNSDEKTQPPRCAKRCLHSQ